MAKCRYVPFVLSSPLYSQVPLSTLSIPLQTVSSRFSSPSTQFPVVLSQSELVVGIPSSVRSKSFFSPAAFCSSSVPSVLEVLVLVLGAIHVAVAWDGLASRRSIVVVSLVVSCCVPAIPVRVVPCGSSCVCLPWVC